MDYYKIVAEGRPERIKTAVEKIVDEFQCSVLSAPSSGMIMVKHIDPIEKTPFYLGEAFVTQCEVEIKGEIGYGCVLGDEPERALYGAIIDAVLGNGFNLPHKAVEVLNDEMEYIKHKHKKEDGQILKTKVNFDVKKG